MIGFIVFSVVVVLFGILLKDFAVDDAYITFRHAQNLVRGDGFNFNPGDRLLSTTSPLHALLLALLSSVGISNLPRIAVWLSVASMIVLCASLLLTFTHLREPITGLLCVLLVISQHWLYRFFSLETILVLALNVTAVALALRHHWAWAGVVAGFAMIGRPDSIILAGTLALYALISSKFRFQEFWRYAIACALVYGAWFVFSLFYFGTPFPNTLEAKSGFNTWTVFAANIWPKMLKDLIADKWQLEALLLVFAGIGCVDLLIRRSPLLIFPIWAILHTLGYTLLRIVYPFAWYYAPLILIALLLASVGGMAIIRWASSRLYARSRLLAWTTVTGVALFFVLFAFFSMQYAWAFVSSYETAYYAGARDHVYRQVGNWLAENSDADATVALTEVGTIGYFSQRRIIDMAGLVTYELRNLPKQGTFRETVEALQPDFIIGTRGLPPDPELTGFDGYSIAIQFPKGADNLFEDVVIYQKDGSE